MKGNKIVQPLAVIGFALAFINSIFAFGSASSTGYVEVFFVIIFAAFVILSLYLTKDAKASLPVISAAVLYTGGLAVRSVIFFFDAIINFSRRLRLSNLTDKRDYGDLGSEARGKILEKIDAIRETIAKDTIGEFFDVLCILIAIAVAMFAVLAIIDILKGKDFEKTPQGKVTSRIIGTDDEKYE